MNITTKTIIALLGIGILTSCGLKDKLDKQAKAKANADYIMNNLGASNILKEFPEKYFPKDQTEPFLKGLTSNCDFENKEGKFVDFFNMSINGNTQMAYIYEYILDCDSLRFIYYYDFQNENPELFKFFIEGIEIENAMIIDPSKTILGGAKK